MVWRRKVKSYPTAGCTTRRITHGQNCIRSRTTNECGTKVCTSTTNWSSSVASRPTFLPRGSQWWAPHWLVLDTFANWMSFSSQEHAKQLLVIPSAPKSLLRLSLETCVKCTKVVGESSVAVLPRHLQSLIRSRRKAVYWELVFFFFSPCPLSSFKFSPLILQQVLAGEGNTKIFLPQCSLFMDICMDRELFLKIKIIFRRFHFTDDGHKMTLLRFTCERMKETDSGFRLLAT